MSIDYGAFIYRGYKISSNDIDLDELVFEELIDNNLIHFLNPMEDPSDYILGYEVMKVEEGECAILDPNIFNSIKWDQKDQKIIDLAHKYFKNFIETNKPQIYYTLTVS